MPMPSATDAGRALRAEAEIPYAVVERLGMGLQPLVDLHAALDCGDVRRAGHARTRRDRSLTPPEPDATGA
jgi:hypothetical protein